MYRPAQCSRLAEGYGCACLRAGRCRQLVSRAGWLTGSQKHRQYSRRREQAEDWCSCGLWMSVWSPDWGRVGTAAPRALLSYPSHVWPLLPSAASRPPQSEGLRGHAERPIRGSDGTTDHAIRFNAANMHAMHILYQLALNPSTAPLTGTEAATHCISSNSRCICYQDTR